MLCSVSWKENTKQRKKRLFSAVLCVGALWFRALRFSQAPFQYYSKRIPEPNQNESRRGSSLSSSHCLSIKALSSDQRARPQNSNGSKAVLRAERVSDKSNICRDEYLDLVSPWLLWNASFQIMRWDIEGDSSGHIVLTEINGVLTVLMHFS